MILKYVSAAAALAVATLGLAAPVSAQNAEGVAAIVNDKVISTFDVRQRATMLLMFANLQPTAELQQRARAQALRDLVDEHLQLQEAAKFEIAVTGDQIDRHLTDMASRADRSLDQLVSDLARNGVSVGTLRSQIEAEIAWQRLISGLYGNRVRVSETEIQETQQRIAANARQPQYEMSEIFLPASTPQEFSEMEQGAMRLLEQMQQRQVPFPAVARQFSQSPSAATGGDLGWISANELSTELRPVADRLQAGQVSLPVRTSTGVYLLAMRNRRAGIPEGASTLVTLRQVTTPAARRNVLERIRRRGGGCSGLDNSINGIQGASVVDLGQTIEAELSPAIRSRLEGVNVGGASQVVVDGEQASIIVLCSRETGGSAIPDRRQIEDRLREAELAMLAERYLRDLRREATIITRQ
ncbi:MAG: peptidylprolyl isomerase [Caulobacteraceae bacterium]